MARAKTVRGNNTNTNSMKTAKKAKQKTAPLPYDGKAEDMDVWCDATRKREGAMYRECEELQRKMYHLKVELAEKGAELKRLRELNDEIHSHWVIHSRAGDALNSLAKLRDHLPEEVTQGKTKDGSPVWGLLSHAMSNQQWVMGLAKDHRDRLLKQEEPVTTKDSPPVDTGTNTTTQQ